MFQELLALFISTLISVFGMYVSTLQNEQGSLEPNDAVVVSVIDGDTIEVSINGEKETVRYIGIDTPEPYRDGDPACWSKEASERNRELVGGKTVTLVSDKADKDKYGRLLRYVYVGEVFVNEALVKEGYAKTLRIKPNTEFAQEFSEFQKTAQEEKKGMWDECM